MLLSLFITLVVGLIVVGVICWGIQNFPWIDADFKQAAKVAVVVIAVIWFLATLLGYVPVLPYPRR